MAQQPSAQSSEYVPAAARQRRAGPVRWLLGFLIVLALVATAGFVVWNELFREIPTYYADETDHFKYGSIGNEADGGIPYWVWLALPRVFPEYLPGDGGYAAFGMIVEPGEWKGGQWVGGETPVGFSKKTIGFPRVAMNCALCHHTPVRLPGEVAPKIYLAGPAHHLNAQGYLRFLFACAHDDRFTADILLGEISYDVALSPLEQALYRYVIIPRTRQGLFELEKQYDWMASRPDWGRGRIDPFNPVKYNVLKMPRDDTIGNADMPPIWNMAAHAGFAYHWDGMNSDIHDVVLSSAIGDGSTRDSIALAGLNRVQDFLLKLPSPKYPLPTDSAKAAKGKGIFTQKCADCHAFGGARTGKVVTVDEVGTDGERHRLWTSDAATRYNAYAAGYPWKFSGFRGTDGRDGGYVSVPLDGIWIRAPYLHNGSVPSLRDLLKPPDARPKEFWRGSDLYDPERVGFDSFSEEARRIGTHFSTLDKGNGNKGHTYGTELPDDQKDALVEYLKTL
jgi:hypothetical protein